MRGMNEIVGLDDRARSMRDPEWRLLCTGMLAAPHMVSLTEYAETLRKMGYGEVPQFDPLDGGIEALALFLFEKPGPMTSNSKSDKRLGSGFISRNNDDPTAEATFNFMRTAGIPREQTIIWNVIPWWNGKRKVTGSELNAGVRRVKEMIGLLPKLRAVVFVGQKAAKARPRLMDTGLDLFSSYHPSPLVRATHPERWHTIPSDWAKIRPVLDLR